MIFLFVCETRNSEIVGLDAVPGIGAAMLKGETTGRYVVDPSK